MFTIDGAVVLQWAKTSPRPRFVYFFFTPPAQKPAMYAHVCAGEYIFLPSVKGEWFHVVVPGTGLEPVRLAAADFKSAVSTYSTTRADGADCRDRTDDLRITSALLYH